MPSVIKGDSNVNLDFSTGGRITGDFSNATQANRVLFQSTTANGNTSVQCVPNGAATTSGFGAFNSSDPANAGRWYINATSSLVNMSADKTGTGSYLPMTFNTGGSERMRIDTSGNVGIGTSSPSTYANSQAPVLVIGTGNNFATVQGRTDGPSGATNGVAFGGSYSTNPINGSRITLNAEGSAGQRGSISFWTKPTDDDTNQPTERARIDNSGNFLFNKTSTAASGSGICFQTNDSSQFYRGGDGQAIQFFRSSTQVGNISVTATATAYNTSSDYRLKEAVAPMTGALAKVAALKPVTYKWKLDGSAGEGFIAHELAEVVPGCVTGKKDAVDAEGNPVYQGIDTSFLVATLTAAIQEQQALINDLTARIAALEAA